MKTYKRSLGEDILFGARQTGKSTLIREALPTDAYIFNLAEHLTTY